MSVTEPHPSKQARQFRAWIENPSNFPATCDGGDFGTPDSPSIWLFGLEPGWSVSDQNSHESGERNSEEDRRSYSVELQLGWPFNRNAFKLLAALQGQSAESYVAFATKQRPFEKGCSGYFKGNLFPAACNRLGDWLEEHVLETGFGSKAAYQKWMRAVRLPIIKTWVERCRPKLLLCSGLTHLDDFLDATATPIISQPHEFEVNGHLKRVYLSAQGIVPIAVIPHLSGGIHSLNSFQAISHTADYIATELGWRQ